MSQSTNVEITQTTREVASGGSVVGVQTQSLTVMGSFIVRPPDDQTPEAPNDEIICAYLANKKEQAIKTDLESASAKHVMLRDAFRKQSKNVENSNHRQSQPGTSETSAGASPEVNISGKDDVKKQTEEIRKLLDPLWKIPFQARRAEDARPSRYMRRSKGSLKRDSSTAPINALCCSLIRGWVRPLHLWMCRENVRKRA